jgi:DNA invertase Pin-like site-specific DNA recombinase
MTPACNYPLILSFLSTVVERNDKMSQPRRFVAYLRVSTAKQGRSGLGLEAQREAVCQFVARHNGKMIAPEFIEIETGKRDDRPELQKALKRCRLTGATLVVAKLDRLSRNAAFLMTLRDSGVEFVAADLPEANTMTVGVMAVVAQHEREAISARTKAALAAARARGKALGGFRPAAPNIAKFQRQGVEAARQRALRAAEERREAIEALRREKLSLNAIAARLNADSVRTSGGSSWTATAVKRTLKLLHA